MVYGQVIVLKKWFVTGVLFFLLSVDVWAKTPTSISAASAVLYDPLSETVLFSQNADMPRGMASTTKIMTALVALEQYELEQPVTVSAEWCGIEGSSMYLQPKEQLTVSDLLHGLLLLSGNDAAEALAGLDPEGKAGFVQKMNAKAAVLGLQKTHFDNPSGLDGETHYTTALELAKITAEAMENPVFAEIVRTPSKNVAGRWMKNHNRLLTEMDACGVKTGYTKSCGRCLVSAKEQNGRMLICVTLNAPDDWSDHKALMDYGFSLYQSYDLLGAGDCGSVPLISSTKPSSRLYCNESYSCYLTEQELSDVEIKLYGPRFWYGQTVAGETYGSLKVILYNEVLFETQVCFADNSAESVLEKTWFQKWLDFLFRGRER